MVSFFFSAIARLLHHGVCRAFLRSSIYRGGIGGRETGVFFFISVADVTILAFGMTSIYQLSVLLRVYLLSF